MSSPARTAALPQSPALSWSCSLLSTLAPRASVAMLADLAVSHGAVGLELRCEAGHAHGVELGLEPAGREQIRQTVTAAGVTITDLASALRLGVSPVDAFVRYLQLADDVGASGVRIFCDDRRAEETELAWLERLAAAAAGVHDMLGERMSRFWIENHGTASESHILCRATDARFGFVWDVGHSSSHGEEPSTVWERIGDRVRHVHVKDWRRDASDKWDRNCPLLEGDLQIEAALGVLAGARYAGCISVEVPGPAGLGDLRRLVEWRRRKVADTAAT